MNLNRLTVILQQGRFVRNAEGDVFQINNIGVRLHCNTLEECAFGVRRYVEENNLGASEYTGGKVMDEDFKPIAYISYNGRIWGPDHCPEYLKGA